MWHTFVVFLHFERDILNARIWKKKSFHPQNRERHETEFQSSQHFVSQLLSEEK